MTLSRANLRAAFVALAIALAGISVTLPQTNAGQSVSIGDLSKRALPAIVSLRIEDVNGNSGTPGTGFFIGSGKVATDYRVIKDAIKIQGATPGEDSFDLAIAAVDERRTVAILKVVPAGAPAGGQQNRSLTLQKKALPLPVHVGEQPAVGDEVYLFSNYAGGVLLLGKIDDLREEAGARYLHLAGMLGPDSVGSPVLNSQGRVVGMVVANPSDGGTPAFAIPADQIGECSAPVTYLGSSGGATRVLPGDSTKRTRNEEAASSSSGSGDPSSPQPVRKSGGVLQASALRRVQPPYPPLAKAARLSGAVVVEVTVDQEGDVLSARAVSGHPLLKDCAMSAARGWKFKPTTLSGTPVKVIGTITFDFSIGGDSAGIDRAGAVTGQSGDSGRGAGSTEAGRHSEPATDAGNDTIVAATEVDSQPVLLNRPRPNYTDLARAHRIVGTASLRILVGSDGIVKRVDVIKGLPDGLTEESTRAAYELRFKPAMKDGQPVAYWTKMEIEFNLGS